MRIINKSEFATHEESIFERQAFPAISIGFTSSRMWQKNEKSIIKLKNSVSSIETRLSKNGLSAVDIKKLINPITNLYTKSSFWKKTQRGILIYRSQTQNLGVLLPNKIKDFTYIGNYFSVKPLIPYLFESEEFYFLYINKEKTTLYKAEKTDFELIGSDDFFGLSLGAQLDNPDAQKSLQHHSTKAITHNKRGSHMYHGQGAFKDNKEKLITEYVTQINSTLPLLIENYELPLIVSASDFIFNKFKNLCKYDNLLSQHVHINMRTTYPSSRQARDIWDKVASEMNRDKNALIEEFFSSSNSTHDSFAKLLHFASIGKIGKLLVKDKSSIWGLYDVAENSIMLHKRKKDISRDLLNLLYIFVVTNGGYIYDFSKVTSTLPADVNAIYRY